jgi:hypothetical protein
MFHLVTSAFRHSGIGVADFLQIFAFSYHSGDRKYISSKDSVESSSFWIPSCSLIHLAEFENETSLIASDSNH